MTTSTPPEPSMVVWRVLAGIGVVGTIGAIAHIAKPRSAREEQIAAQERMADFVYETAKAKLLESIRSPSTAVFPPRRSSSVRVSPTGVEDDVDLGEWWIVRSHVDAMNGFGAPIRSRWEADVPVHPRRGADPYRTHVRLLRDTDSRR